MGDRAEQMLRQWGVPPNYVGYAYLLDAADLFRQGVAPSPQLFETIAPRQAGVPGPQGDGQRGQVPAHHRHGPGLAAGAGQAPVPLGRDLSAVGGSGEGAALAVSPLPAKRQPRLGCLFCMQQGRGGACAGRRPYMLCWRMSTISWWVSTL